MHQTHTAPFLPPWAPESIATIGWSWSCRRSSWILRQPARRKKTTLLSVLLFGSFHRPCYTVAVPTTVIQPLHCSTRPRCHSTAHVIASLSVHWAKLKRMLDRTLNSIAFLIVSEQTLHTSILLPTKLPCVMIWRSFQKKRHMATSKIYLKEYCNSN
jgi:hypothetical protein